ncbi:MAG TPA: efflux RND transporter permease subunit [Oscillatoriaceae cyanobacterium]
MNWNISAWAIKNPVPVILLFVVLTISGLVAFHGLGVDDNPNVDFPMIVVSVGEPGASPSEMETEVTRKVEDALIGIAGLDHITSTVTEGSSTTMIEFEIGTNSETALNDVRDAVSRIRQDLPADISEPSITHPNFSGDPFITYTVSSDKRSVAQLSRLVDEDITRSLLTVTGVAQVTRSGGVDREIRVDLDPTRLQALGITADYVNTQLRGLNINMPGGMAQVGQQEETIRTLGAATTVSELAADQIPLPSGGTVRLDTLGTIKDTHSEIRQMAFLNGQPCVAFSVARSQGSAIVQTEEAVRAQVATLQKTLPPDVHIKLVRSMADFTREAYQSSMDALYVGAFLAVLVIFAFLRSWQATLIAALAIPISVISTFMVMNWLGYTLNGITLLGLTLVVGILVDDAIVDLENIHRHIDMGKAPYEAAIEATNEIGLAVIATTATIVAVFVPVAFMGGIPGQFFRSFGITVAVAVLFSLLVARTLTPMMAAYILPKHTGGPVREPFYRRFYVRFLGRTLNWRWVTLGCAALLFVLSLTLVPLIPKGLMTYSDIGQISVAVDLPPGSTIEQTENAVLAASKVFEGRSEVKAVFSTIGTAAANGLRSTGGAVSNGTVNVILTDSHQRKLSQSQLQDLLRPQLDKIPGARISYNSFGVGGATKPLSIILRSNDPVTLARVSDQLLTQMRQLPELRDVSSSAAELQPELEIKPDLARAAEQGVSVSSIGRVARLATQGDVEFNLAKFTDGDQEIPILVELAPSYRQDLSTIGNLLVPGSHGYVPLDTVADIQLGSGPVQINRYDRARQVTLSANLTQGDLGGAMAKVTALPALKNLPASVTQGTLGDTKIMIDIFSSFALALGTGVMFIYVVLVLLFGNFTQPLTIMIALPMSIGGALLGLMIGHKELDMMALIGIVMLMGLVCKNSILLVEYAIRARHSGLPRREALISAGHDRLRPILMTTIAMIAGMLPIALQLGKGSDRLSPMAVAVIGGLITSTLLTLVVVPSAYTVIDGLQRRFWKLIGRPLPEPSAPSEDAPETKVTVSNS